MIYIRGHASDYDDWAAQGAQDLSLPRNSLLQARGGQRALVAAQRGPRSMSSTRWPNPLNEVFLGRSQLQLQRNNDFNGSIREGRRPLPGDAKNGGAGRGARLLPPGLTRARTCGSRHMRALRVQLWDGVPPATSAGFRRGRRSARAARSLGRCLPVAHLLLGSGLGPSLPGTASRSLTSCRAWGRTCKITSISR
jgi:hypothetical protein